MQSSENLKLKQQSLTKSSVSIYDNLNMYTTIENDDTDNDKDSLVFNLDDSQVESITESKQIYLPSKRNDKSLDNLFNRLSLECDRTIEQCRQMIQSISTTNGRNKNSSATSLSTSSSSSSSLSITAQDTKFEKKKKLRRKKFPKYKFPAFESNDDEIEDELSSRREKILHKRKVKNCLDCEKRSISCCASFQKASINRNFQPNIIYIKFPIPPAH
jgi:hypothetical protein